MRQIKVLFELRIDSYMEAVKRFPSPNKKLKQRGIAFFQKMDIFKEMLWYATDSNPNDWVPLKLEQVNEILEANANGEFPEDLAEFRFEEVKIEKSNELQVADFVGGNAEIA